MKKYLFIILLVGVCCCEDAEQTHSNLDETTNGITLPAFRERTDISFDKKTRDLNTLVFDSLSFNYIFPSTDISCGHLIRYYFHTNIHLGKVSNELISMGGSIFRFDNFDNAQQKEYIINLSKQVITTIGDMYYGSSELQEFLVAYPNVDLSN
tara:strand:- start:3206 stop:3664 length:459 start_codon:yes stop_codon:yes gene_type:complete